MNEPDSPASARQTGDTAFSYACHRCRRCCHDKLIQVNPYEIARLARRLGLTTTVFIRDYLADQPHLRRTDDGACVFLGPEGCTVHPDRPLGCRVYPLGRHIQVGGEPRYLRIEPHPQSAGVYGTDGTIDRYLAGQGVADFIAAADQYLSVLQALFDAWRRAPWVVEDQPAAGAEAGAEAPDLLDLDKAVAEYCRQRSRPEPVGIEDRMRLHLAAIAEWLKAQPVAAGKNPASR